MDFKEEDSMAKTVPIGKYKQLTKIQESMFEDDEDTKNYNEDLR